MISSLRVKNYRVFDDFSIQFSDGMNILVGDNEAGKSTILEAITLALSGRLHGRWVRDDLNPYWFNQSVVNKFFDSLDSDSENQNPPEILIEVTLVPSKKQDTGIYARLRGMNNSINEDAAGLVMRIAPDPDLADEFKEYLTQDNLPKIIPTEFYQCDWHSYKGDTVTRQPHDVSFSMIDSRTTFGSSGVDYYIKSLLKDYVPKETSRQISLAQRKSRLDITENLLNALTEQYASEDEQSFRLGLQMDQSVNSSWESDVVPEIDSIPFNMSGQGHQVRAKVELALSRNSDRHVVLVEEPENHFSHTSLLSLLDRLGSINDQQVICSTHSPYVLNRLGLDRLILLYKGRKTDFGQISPDTVDFFRHLSGYDTLRLVIARKLVVVEGPSDEMIFKWAYKKKYGHTPESDNIDVVAFGIRGKRVLELTSALNRHTAILRDNDGQSPAYWENAYQAYMKGKGSKLFIGEVVQGNTLEPQFVHANPNNIEQLTKLLEYPGDVKSEDNLIDWMEKHKTEWAWKVVSSSASQILSAPEYINRAVKFIHDDQKQ